MIEPVLPPAATPPSVPLEQQRSAVIALVGAPNVGKSTLVNRLVGEKVSIVSPKPQTTRNRVLGICMAEDAQLVLMDTPGVFAAQGRFEQAMVKAAWQAVEEADRVLMLVDCRNGLTPATKRVLEKLIALGRPVTLVLNKVDIVEKPRLLELTVELNALTTFEATFMISALKGDGLDDLTRYLAKDARTLPWPFPEDQLTNLSERLLAAEITREQLFHRLNKELPYSAFVETEQWKNTRDGAVIHQVIYVQRESQKAIVVGKGGVQLKRIGQTARLELERMLDCRIHLFLHVKVKENWQSSNELLALLGLVG